MRGVTVRLTPQELARINELAREIVAYCEKMGYAYRHPGLDPITSRIIGLMGEKAVATFLDGQGIAYKESPKCVPLNEWTQDFELPDTNIGVKTCKVNHVDQTKRWPGFLYPCKYGKTKRVLPYPDYLVQCAANPQKGVVWIIGWVTKFAVMTAPTLIPPNRLGIPNPEKAHRIPWGYYQPMELLPDQLKVPEYELALWN